MARKIEVQIVGDADSFHRAIGKATSSTSKFGSVLGGAFSVGAAAAGTALVGLGIAAKIGFDEFDQHQKAMAQTNAVLKSTGGVANVTAGHVTDLANQLLNLSGVDDEVIQGGENVLLTFRNIRNEAGKNNDIFDQATRASLDLSVAMGEDLHSASIQVGKALNDPVHGLTALKRVGVQFTDSQTNLIKKLVETGHTAKAQKIILGELHKEFGGSAQAAGKTLGGQLEILKQKFKNAAGEVVSGLLPYVLKFAQFALPLASAALKIVVDDLKHAIKWIGEFASHFDILGGKSTSASDRIKNAWQIVYSFFQQKIMPIIKDLRSIFTQAMTAIAHTVQQHGDELRRIAGRIGSALQAVAKVAIPILKFALVKVLPTAIGIAIDALDLITGAIGDVVDVVKWIANHSRGAFNGLKSVINSVSEPIESALSGVASVIGRIVSALRWVINHLGSITGAFNSIKDAAGSVLGKIPLINSVAGVGPASATGGGITTGRTPPLAVNVYLDGKQIHTSVQNQDRVYRRQNGRSAFA